MDNRNSSKEDRRHRRVRIYRVERVHPQEQGHHIRLRLKVEGSKALNKESHVMVFEFNLN